jgi:hydantoinase/carbamoylase family amidase
VAATVQVDRSRSAARIEADVEALAGRDYTVSETAISRYAYTQAYRNTLDYFRRELEAIGFRVEEDPVGNLVARNRPRGEKVFGVGSHCDSNRNGGRYDGTLGVVTALEICRLNEELGLDLPLQLVSFLEEESSGFAQPLLGSRIVAQRVTEEDLRTYRAIDDGRPFWDHAREAGYEPERWRECRHMLDDLACWIELHIEQGRVLQDAGERIGVVTAIVGLIWADLVVRGRADHAGGTPMGYRRDASVVAAECVLELERLATEAARSVATVGTAGENDTFPGIINAIPGEVRLGLDIRSVDRSTYRRVETAIAEFARDAAERRGMTADYVRRNETPPTGMDEDVVAALEAAARTSGEPYRLMPSGGGHDTQLVAPLVPSAMVFVPCRDGISHSPDEEANPADAALGAEIVLNAIGSLAGR